MNKTQIVQVVGAVASLSPDAMVRRKTIERARVLFFARVNGVSVGPGLSPQIAGGRYRQFLTDKSK